MTPYLVGALGGAVGIIAALWFRFKLARLEGKHGLLSYKHEVLEVDYSNMLATTERALHKKDVELKGIRKREKRYRERLRKFESDPANIDSLVADLNDGV